ncbi:MAG: c-type cytochrome [Proteobacteria bacterium]|jgi:cytochrome c5|nr:c-type cytochrome [Pseudomonadota bacterium]MDA0954556.1 c-type cytochrome [Pseudomonadota bacterium]
MLKTTLIALALTIAGSTAAWALSDKQRAAIEARIAPVGEVCLLGDSSCGGAVAVANAAPRSGEEVYNSACMACHVSGAGGAPIVGDIAAWQPRIAVGMAALYDSGVNGVPGTSMMAKGGCMSCSDEEINGAVDFMVAGSQ